jgi:hypothetical protein
MQTRIEFATDWILSRIEASEAQHQQVKALVQATVQDLAQMREQHHRNRQALLQAARAGYRSMLRAPHASWARRGRWRRLLGGAARGVVQKGLLVFLSAWCD